MTSHVQTLCEHDHESLCYNGVIPRIPLASDAMSDNPYQSPESAASDADQLTQAPVWRRLLCLPFIFFGIFFFCFVGIGGAFTASLDAIRGTPGDAGGWGAIAIGLAVGAVLLWIGWLVQKPPAAQE